MVAGLWAVDTAGTSVSQWADTATMALGRGRSWPSDAMKRRAGRSSRISMGEPCETKTVGIDIALFLARPMAACVQSGFRIREDRYHARFTDFGAFCSLPRPLVGSPGRRPDLEDGRPFRPQGARSDLDDRLHHAQPRL